MGNAWHASLGLQAGLTEDLGANIEADYLRIQTTGSYRLVKDSFAIDMSFDNGVKGWSEQISLMTSLEHLF